jgi:hypothetical protein
MAWIKISGDAIETTSAGRLFTHILQGAFFIKRIEELRQNETKVHNGGAK